MVYCTKCGTENPDDASNCKNCGASLNPLHIGFDANMEMTYAGGRAIWGLIIGLFIILIGVSALIRIDIWSYIWAIFIIIIGLVIVVNSVRRRS
jgi:hypothetical protein